MRKALNWVGLGLAGMLLILVVWALLPARTPSIAGESSIASLEAVDIGGVKQWLLLRGQDRTNPVLLVVHGGPGASMMPIARQYTSRLEDHFVVVHWDQRGAGKSCSDDVPGETLRLEQHLADTLELVGLLRERFEAEKIYLLGHSWGSILGAFAVQKHPELFHAYVGLGQFVNGGRNEELSYEFTLEQARAEGNQEAIDELSKIHPPYDSIDELSAQRSWLMHYRGSVFKGDGMRRLITSIAGASELTVGDKLNYFPCMLSSLEYTWDELEALDLERDVPRLEVPVYLFLGRHDYNAPFELAKQWAARLEAPHVEIVWFEESAHMAHLEEPDRFQSALIERVLGGRGRTRSDG